MNELAITYLDIPKYCDHVDRDKRSIVVLSAFQAKLYKRMTQHHLKQLRGAAFIFDLIYFGCLLFCVLICARNLFLLADFHRHDDLSISAIEFKKDGNGKTTVIFNPNAEPNVVKV